MLTTLHENLKKKGETYERILGDPVAVKDFVMFWKKHSSELQLVVTYLTTNFVLNNDFTKEELNMYRFAQAELIDFFVKCEEEQYMQQVKLDNGIIKPLQ